MLTIYSIEDPFKVSRMYMFVIVGLLVAVPLVLLGLGVLIREVYLQG